MDNSTSIDYQKALLIVNTATPILVGLVGYFIKRTIEKVEDRLDAHDERIVDLVGNVQRLIGLNDRWNGYERRSR